jgi:NADH-quinone oxidoreductase subunit J
MIRTLILVTVVAGVAALGARPAAADDPHERPCQPAVEAGVRTALGTSLAPGAHIVCPVYGPEVRIVDGKAVPDHPDVVTAEAVLADGRIAKLDLTPDGKVRGMTYVHGDLVASSGKVGKVMALLFWAFALAAVAGALFVISRRNLIAAVMGMVGSFLGIAAIYMMLYAQFLAVVQMLVYAGAIMVLFVFVVMILNRPEDEPVAPSGRAGQVIGGLAILYLVGRLILILMQVEPPNQAAAMAAPLATPEGYDWGSIRAVGTDLFGPGLFPFEAISILLLVAVVGAIAIARPLHAEDDAPAKARSEGGVA